MKAHRIFAVMLLSWSSYYAAYRSQDYSQASVDQSEPSHSNGLTPRPPSHSAAFRPGNTCNCSNSYTLTLYRALSCCGFAPIHLFLALSAPKLQGFTRFNALAGHMFSSFACEQSICTLTLYRALCCCGLVSIHLFLALSAPNLGGFTRFISVAGHTFSSIDCEQSNAMPTEHLLT